MPHPLFDKLAQYRDIESAITIYLEAAAGIAELEEIKQIARNRITTYLAKTGETLYKCQAGTAKHTKPRTPKLDNKAWEEAVLRDPVLMNEHRKFKIAEADLKTAQYPFTKLPDPQLRITRA